MAIVAGLPGIGEDVADYVRTRWKMDEAAMLIWRSPRPLLWLAEHPVGQPFDMITVQRSLDAPIGIGPWCVTVYRRIGPDRMRARKVLTLYAATAEDGKALAREALFGS